LNIENQDKKMMGIKFQAESMFNQDNKFNLTSESIPLANK